MSATQAFAIVINGAPDEIFEAAIAYALGRALAIQCGDIDGLGVVIRATYDTDEEALSFEIDADYQNTTLPLELIDGRLYDIIGLFRKHGQEWVNEYVASTDESHDAN